MDNRYKHLNVLLFLQFVLINAMSIYNMSSDLTKHISFLLLLIGYWIDPSKKKYTS